MKLLKIIGWSILIILAILRVKTMVVDRECGLRGLLPIRPPEVWCCGTKPVLNDFEMMYCVNESISYYGFTCQNPNELCDEE